MPSVIRVSPEVNQAREAFFRAIFGDETGWVCVAVLEMDSKKFEERYFEYPKQLNNMLEHVNRNYPGKNVYFCPQLLRVAKRDKMHVKTCTVVWADLDACPPEAVDPPPSISLETSPERYQGFWLLSEPVEPLDAEDASHRLAYAYANKGADTTGWDLSQLLRVPITYNAKYQELGSLPVVRFHTVETTRYPIARFFEFPQVPGYESLDEPMPENIPNPEDVLKKRSNVLDPQVAELFLTEPQGDWSSALWQLELLMLEAGCSKEETFAVANAAKCNKFARDRRPAIYLWKDIVRASLKIDTRNEALGVTPPEEKPLLTMEERKLVTGDTFVERFTSWAKSRGDAAPQYFEAGAFTILSALLSGVVKLPTSFGVMVPNLWFMILADTTLTRKSTAMDMAMDMLLEVEPDAILATDGSIEGLMTSIASRPGRPGIFWRDEFSGLLAAIKTKDYLAGMGETLTKLYDGKYQKRILRKETIEIRDPIVILLAGGIRGKILELMDSEHVSSGFAPRFIFVEAESDIRNFKPMGPMTSSQDATKDHLINELQTIKDRYSSEMTIKLGDQTVKQPAVFNAYLSEEAWDRYNKLEREMLQYGLDSGAPELFTPTMDRLAKSTLKVAVLLAAARQTPEDGKVHVELTDILRAIMFAEKWRSWASDVIANVGKTISERKLDQILAGIRRHPSIGITRSKLMQNYHLTARDADWILQTLDQRGLIRKVDSDKTQRLFPTVVR